MESPTNNVRRRSPHDPSGVRWACDSGADHACRNCRSSRPDRWFPHCRTEGPTSMYRRRSPHVPCGGMWQRRGSRMFYTTVKTHLFRATCHCSHTKPLVHFKYFLVPELCHLGLPWLALGSQFDVPGAVVCPSAPKRTYGTAPMAVVRCKTLNGSINGHGKFAMVALIKFLKLLLMLAMAPLYPRGEG